MALRAAGDTRATTPSASRACAAPGAERPSPACSRAFTGYLASLAAHLGTEGIDDTLGAVGHHLHTYEIVSHTAFADRVARRRQEMELR